MMRRMGDANDEWLRVGRAVEARMHELGLTKAELSRLSNISDTSLTGYMRGQPIVRVDKARALTRALGWTDDSIDRLRRGDPPFERRKALLDAALGHRDESTPRATGFFDDMRLIEDLVARVHDLEQRIAELEDAQRGNPDETAEETLTTRARRVARAVRADVPTAPATRGEPSPDPRGDVR